MLTPRYGDDGLKPLVSIITILSLNQFMNKVKFSSGRKVAILSGVVLNAYIFQTIHRTETEIASFEKG